MEDLGPPTSYLALADGVPVLTSDGVDIGRVRHVLADADDDIFDGLVLDVRDGGHRFVDAPEVAALYERAVVLKLDAAACERLPRPGENPAVVDVDPADTAESGLQRKLRRAWDRISGNY